MNPNQRRRFKNLLSNSEDATQRRRVPAPAVARRKRADKAAGSAWLFADFLAAAMTLPADQLADLE